MKARGCSHGLLVTCVAVLGVLLGAQSQAWGVGNCPNEGFRTGPSAGLPDCRAYEMVSPPDKNGGQVDGGLRFGGIVVPPQQASPDGEAITYGSTSAFTETAPASSLVATQYISRRTATGWSTRAVTPEQQIPSGQVKSISNSDPDFSLFQGFNEDLSAGFLLAWTPAPDPAAPEGYFNPYLLDGESLTYQLLSDVVPPVQPPGAVELEHEGFGSVYAGMSADGRHVIFEANDALTPEAIPGQVNLYEWNAGQPLELVSVLPDGAVNTEGTPFTVMYASSLHFGSAESEEVPFNYSDVLSSDGRRAFWSGGEAGGGHIYMHELTGSGARTVDISAAQGVSEVAPRASYWTASPDGTYVYFTARAELTADASSVGDLYQYDADTGALRDLTVDPNAGEAANVAGVLGMGESAGAPAVYFVATGELAAGASAGAHNLYVWQGAAGGGPGVTKFIATLGKLKGESYDFSKSTPERTSRVSPDGQFLAFQSAEPLTGYDNLPPNGEPCPVPASTETIVAEFYPETGGKCMEVFEYDARAEKLICVSCDPSGLPATADSLVPEYEHLAQNTIGWESPTVQQRYLLDDGRLYFQSEEALLPQATNDRQNVYEYEPEGVGECVATGGSGCLYLISTGKSSGNSFFADASADGRDVFILSDERLVPQDEDEAIDMYDAREAGGFSAASPPPCSGEACKPPVTPPPPIYGAPSSATFNGIGNAAAPIATPQVKPVKKKAKAKRRSKGKHKAKRRTRKAGKSARRSGRGRR